MAPTGSCSDTASVGLCVIPNPLFTTAPLLTSVAVGRTHRVLWGDAGCHGTVSGAGGVPNPLHLKNEAAGLGGTLPHLLEFYELI